MGRQAMVTDAEWALRALCPSCWPKVTSGPGRHSLPTPGSVLWLELGRGNSDCLFCSNLPDSLFL